MQEQSSINSANQKQSFAHIEVSVVIANRNGGAFLSANLDSLLKDVSSNFEIIVVDDASEDKSLNVLEVFSTAPNVHVIVLKTHMGAAYARNIGVKVSHGKYIFFLDSDTVTDSGWCKAVTSFFDNHSEYVAAQVKLLRAGSENFDSAGDLIGLFGFLSERARGTKDIGQFDSVCPIFSGKSAGMIVRRGEYEEVGGMDEDFIVFYEDSDLCIRFWIAGYKVGFCPDVIVQHYFVTNGKSTEYYRSANVIYLGSRNLITSMIKNYEFIYLLTKALPAICVIAAISVCMIVQRRFHDMIAIQRAILWNCINISKILAKRRKVQTQRLVSDAEIIKQVSAQKSIGYYFMKANSYILGKPY